MSFNKRLEHPWLSVGILEIMPQVTRNYYIKRFHLCSSFKGTKNGGLGVCLAPLNEETFQDDEHSINVAVTKRSIQEQ